ncbi:MAG: futalosine hydrolase [Sphingobacteriales bacterium JAD_PAG50586_3]|nr:MAG: futalosine hydrolase [Sphingobacteriales bacterium JAD_PAG50586_3]
MKTLVVAATEMEIVQAKEALPNVEFLVTGVGMVNTAYKLGKHLAANHYDFIINAGVCGCFSREHNLGTLFNISVDAFADLGADDNGKFIDAFGLGLIDKNEKPFTDGLIINFSHAPFGNLEEVVGITVNTVTGNQQGVDMLLEKYKPVTESMEGAAFAYVCEMENAKYVQIRAASNYVEPRNKEHWQMGLAIKNLNEYLITLLK